MNIYVQFKMATVTRSFQNISKHSDFDMQHFIQVIRDRPYMWDNTDELYTIRKNDSTKWDEISQLFHRPVDELKMKWRSVRSTYHRKLFEIQNKQMDSAKRDHIRRWRYFDALEFLRPIFEVPSLLKTGLDCEDSQSTSSAKKEWSGSEQAICLLNDTYENNGEEFHKNVEIFDQQGDQQSAATALEIEFVYSQDDDISDVEGVSSEILKSAQLGEINHETSTLEIPISKETRARLQATRKRKMEEKKSAEKKRKENVLSYQDCQLRVVEPKRQNTAENLDTSKETSAMSFLKSLEEYMLQLTSFEQLNIRIKMMELLQKAVVDHDRNLNK